MGTSQSRHYRTIRTLGTGSYGVVTLVQDKRDQQYYALKKIRFKTKEEKEKAEAEAHLLSDCSHPNIVKAHSFYREEGWLSSEIGILMEYCDGGSLLDMINNRRENVLGLIPEKEILEIFVQICDGVAYLHMEKKMIHRDLKIDNILIKEGEMKIADVGVARIMGPRLQRTNTITGTPLYMAPEIYQKEYSYPADIFALGCILKELCTLNRIEHYSDEGIPLIYSKGLRELCKSMLDINPLNRPNINQILKHCRELLTSRPIQPAQSTLWSKLFNFFSIFSPHVPTPSLSLSSIKTKVKMSIASLFQFHIITAIVFFGLFFYLIINWWTN